MAREFLCVYNDMLPTLRNLGNAEVGRLILAALEYNANGKQPTGLVGKEAILWPSFMSQIDRNKEHYKNVCEKNRKNIAKRYERIRSNTTVYDGTQKNIIVENNNNQKRKKSGGGFVPPTRDEVREYVESRNSHVDPDQFFDYFQTGNWHDSKGNPVRNWKQKLLTWEKFQAKDKKQDEDDKPDLSWFYNA